MTEKEREAKVAQLRVLAQVAMSHTTRSASARVTRNVAPPAQRCSSLIACLSFVMIASCQLVCGGDVRRRPVSKPAAVVVVIVRVEQSRVSTPTPDGAR
jgi:hypothetical protein